MMQLWRQSSGIAVIDHSNILVLGSNWLCWYVSRLVVFGRFLQSDGLLKVQASFFCEVLIAFPFSERLTADYWNIILAETDCSTVHSITAPGSQSKWDNKTVANDSQDWANSSLEIPSWLYRCIGWSSLLNHLTDGVSFILHCCWRRFKVSVATPDSRSV